MATSDVIAFSEEQQAAVLGWTFRQPDWWDALVALGVDDKWFSSEATASAWKYVKKFRAAYDRGPTTPDAVAEEVHDDIKTKASLKRALDFCVTEASKVEFEILQTKITEWAKSRVVVSRAQELAKHFNAGRMDEAYKTFQSGETDLARLDAVSGLTQDTFQSSAIRGMEERALRLELAKKSGEYGITFLDDALIDISPTDLILIGARTGAGKTELAKMVAAHNAAMGKRVFYFALEAEENEIEQRIKWGWIWEWYRADGCSTPISYAGWKKGRHEAELSRYEDRADERFQDQFRTLHTYYKLRGEFGIRELESQVYRIQAKNPDLIIIDHLHYIDTETDKNENAEMKRLVKAIRHLSLGLKIPIICVAHLRKRGGSEAKALVPSLDSFHGSSDISKIATTAIVLSKAEGSVVIDNRAIGSPTFIKVVKSRLEGSRTYPTAVCFFNPKTGLYAPDYALGSLNYAETKWEPLKKDPPTWARHATITDASEIEG